MGVQLHLMQLLAVRAYEPFATIRLSLYHLRFADEHAGIGIARMSPGLITGWPRPLTAAKSVTVV